MLFDRSGSRIALTAEGQEFFEVAQQVAIAAQKVRDKAEEMVRRSQSALRLCVAYATFPVEGRNRLLDRYAAIRPDVTVDVSGAEWSDDVLQRVKAGESDFGIAFGPIDDPEIEVCELDELDITIALPQENSLASQDAIAVSDLAGQRFAVTMKDFRSSSIMKRYAWIEDNGAISVHVPEGRRYIFDVAAQKRLCVVCFTTADKVPDDFVRRPFVPPIPVFNVVLVRCKRIMSPAAERFWRLAHELNENAAEAGQD
jgi:DNA-binding transcriptional LysR family regulator